jgi:hypothetical protein
MRLSLLLAICPMLGRSVGHDILIAKIWSRQNHVFCIFLALLAWRIYKLPICFSFTLLIYFQLIDTILLLAIYAAPFHLMTLLVA